MSQGTFWYWRKLLRIDEPVSEEYLKEFKSPLVIFRPLFYLLVYILCKLYFRVKVFGIENIPKNQPYILAPNHQSALDQTMVSYAIGRKRREDLYTLATKLFYDRPVANIFIKIATNALRIDTVEDFFPALRAAAKVLKLKSSVYINPEGTRSETGQLLPFRVGVGVLAVETGAPIVPVYVDGTFRSMPPGRYFPKPVQITVTFGKPIYMDGYFKKKENEMAYDVYKEVTDELFKRVSLLKVGNKDI
jgi:1-acyl-sn-glycerol-3-phosphate acyltransferase